MYFKQVNLGGRLVPLPDVVAKICPDASTEETKKFLEEVLHIAFFQGNK